MNQQEQGGPVQQGNPDIAVRVDQIIKEDLKEIKKNPDHEMRLSAAMISALTQRYGKPDDIGDEGNDELRRALKITGHADTEHGHLAG